MTLLFVSCINLSSVCQLVLTFFRHEWGRIFEIQLKMYFIITSIYQLWKSQSASGKPYTFSSVIITN